LSGSDALAVLRHDGNHDQRAGDDGEHASLNEHGDTSFKTDGSFHPGQRSSPKYARSGFLRPSYGE
jgi:hypothetical protein